MSLSLSSLSSHSLLLLQPAQKKLCINLIRFCNQLQKRVNYFSSKRCRLLQSESGLKTLKNLSCSEKVLLLPPESFYLFRHHQTHSNIDVTTVEGQAKWIASRLSEQEAEKMSKLLDQLLPQLKYRLPSQTLINQLSSLLIEHKITRDIREFEFLEEDFLAVYRHSQPDLRKQPFAHSNQDRVDEGEEIQSKLVEKQLLLPYLQSFQPQIEYYALRILGCASSCHVLTTHLLDIVQIHELAHFISHLGLDHEGRIWFNFDKATRNVIEGVAQDLTWRTIQRQMTSRELEGQSPSPTLLKQANVFQTLMNRQSSPYRIHLMWALNYPSTQHRFMAFQIFRAQSTNFTEVEFEAMMGKISRL